MKNYVLLLACVLGFNLLNAQSKITGELLDNNNEAIIYANVLLQSEDNTTLVKAETTDADGKFTIAGIPAGSYNVAISYVGLADELIPVNLADGEEKNLGTIAMKASSVELETAVITAKRAMVEVKPDRTVFNIQGTINSTGDNALQLMRKAPGVLVDNNNNISVLSRSGVMIYVDGKRLPLSGEQLSNYLSAIPADQIDRMDIITNPGAKYEAEGNAGIIDIRMKKNKSHGANGTISGAYGIGVYPTANASITGNYRNSLMNTFATVGVSDNRSFNNLDFTSYQNGVIVEESNNIVNDNNNLNLRLGTDFYVAPNHIVGFLVEHMNGNGKARSKNGSNIKSQSSSTVIDSILRANNRTDVESDNTTANINYRYDNKKNSINIDLDYGQYDNASSTYQPNLYYDTNENFLSGVVSAYDSPRKINIYTGKIDYETELGKGRLGIGSKYSEVRTDNTFEFYDVINDARQLNNIKSNRFEYDEKVTAGYINYNTQLSQKIGMAAGVRVEHTKSDGVLTPYDSSLQEPPVDQSYTDLFPTVGLTYQAAPMHAFNLNYGRRINRPDYNVLNPFREQLSELSFSRGNPFLKPEIVNNVELGYTYAYRYNFKLGYSLTTDQITRLIGPDESDPRAGFINWDNLAEQRVISANFSAPISITPKWNAYLTVNGSHIDNQATYDNGAVIDLQAWTYSFFQQHTFTLPNKFAAELSGWFSGPGIWGGVFEYETTWSLNLGLSRKFLNDQLNVRLSAQDLFYESGWSGESKFNGLTSTGMGSYDSRRVNLSVSYNFGNKNVKSRKRKTGMDDESKRTKKSS